jgi:hypothetical protein
MSKKILSIVLALCLVSTIFAALPLTAFAASTVASSVAAIEGNFYYEVNEDGVTVTITGYNGSDTELTIPDTLGGYSVTIIGEYALDSHDNITSITIPNSVTEIGWSAFSDCPIDTVNINMTEIPWGFSNDFSDTLKTVNFGNGVKTIGGYAFEYCENLTTITIPDSVTTIGDGAFYGCDDLTIYCNFATYGCAYAIKNEMSYVLLDGNVTDYEDGIIYVVDNGTAIFAYYTGDASELIIPDTLGGYPVTAIGYEAFLYCNSLTSVTIPDSVTAIGDSAFYNCENLTSVTIGNGVTTIGNNAFYACNSLTSVTIGNNVTTIGEWAFEACESLTSITIPNSVTTIGAWAFSDCDSLISVTLGNSVTTIDVEAFYGCDSLTSITIPNSVTEIGYWAFYYCLSLTEINVDSENEYYSSEDGVLFNKEKTELIYYPAGKTQTAYEIPYGVTTIGDEAFFNCDNLTNVTIPNSVTTIGDNAFDDCTSLTSIAILDNVTTIGEEAFVNCSSLTSVTLPNSLTTIGDDAFYLCSSLTDINVSAKNKYFRSDDGVLFNKEKTELLLYPYAKQGPYIVPEGVEVFSFSNCTGLTSVTLPTSVTEIGYEAFYYCTSLESVTIPNSVTIIGDWAFESCTSLTSVTIPNSVTEIGSSAFYYCTSLTDINVDSENDYYSSVDGVLYNKDKTVLMQYPAGKTQTAYAIPNNVTTIGSYAFSGCESLTSVTIPNSVTEIDYEVFFGCDDLTIYCYAGSYAESYAIENEIPYVLLDGKTALLGDADGDGAVTIADVTEIQKYLAQLADFDDEELLIADADGDGNVTVSDATELQKHLASLPANGNIGQPMV